MQIKIGIMGSHGVGKTTIAEAIRKNVENHFSHTPAVVIREVARDCPWEINRGASLQAQEWIFARQIEAENEAFMGNPQDACLIFDRTILDSIIYARYQKFHGLVAAITPYAIYHLSVYDLLFFVRPAWPENEVGTLVADGVRDTDQEYCLAVDREFQKFIQFNRVRVQEVTIQDLGVINNRVSAEILSGFSPG